MRNKKVLSFLLENRNFSLLWTSQILSQITLNMINFVMATRIFEKTGSTLAVSFLWVFYFLPAFFIGPFSGFFVDILNKRKILLYTNFLQAITVTLYLFIGERIYPIYPIVFLYSSLNQFYWPAEASSIPWLVKKKDLALANSLFMLTSQSALVIGSGISGLLIGLFGKNNPVTISAIGLLLAAVAVYFLPKEEFKKSLSWNFSHFWSQIKAGYSFIKNNRIILFPLLMLAAFQIFLVILVISIPSFSRELLGIKVHNAGPLLIVPLGVGAAFGAYLVTKLAKKERKKELLKKGLLTAFFVFMFFSLILPFLGKFKIMSAVLLTFLLGIAGFFIFIPNQTLVQEKTPNRFRGRVFGFLGFISTAVTLPCLLFAATVVDLLGIRLFLFVMGLILLSGVFFIKKAEGMILVSENGNK